MLPFRFCLYFLQKNLLVQSYRPFAYWASVSCDNDDLIHKVKLVNTGCAQDREVIRPAVFKEFGVLTMQDLTMFNSWLCNQDRVTFGDVKGELSRLRHRRWAWWHVMHPDNPHVADECRTRVSVAVMTSLTFSARPTQPGMMA